MADVARKGGGYIRKQRKKIGTKRVGKLWGIAAIGNRLEMAQELSWGIREEEDKKKGN